MSQPLIKKAAIDTTDNGTADKIVATDASGLLPAIDGSNVTNVDAVSLQGLVPGVNPNDIVQLDVAGALPPVDGSNLINVKPTFYGCVVTSSADITCPDNVYTVLGWDTETIDTDNIHDTVTNNDQLVVPAGVNNIRLKAMITFAANANGVRTFNFRKNATTGDISLNIQMPTFSANANAQDVTTIYGESPILQVAPGDYFDLRVGVFNAGGSVNVTTASWFLMEILG